MKKLLFLLFLLAVMPVRAAIIYYPLTSWVTTDPQPTNYIRVTPVSPPSLNNPTGLPIGPGKIFYPTNGIVTNSVSPNVYRLEVQNIGPPQMPLFFTVSTNTPDNTDVRLIMTGGGAYFVTSTTINNIGSGISTNGGSGTNNLLSTPVITGGNANDANNAQSINFGGRALFDEQNNQDLQWGTNVAANGGVKVFKPLIATTQTNSGAITATAFLGTVGASNVVGTVSQAATATTANSGTGAFSGTLVGTGLAITNVHSFDLSKRIGLVSIGDSQSQDNPANETNTVEFIYGTNNPNWALHLFNGPWSNVVNCIFYTNTAAGGDTYSNIWINEWATSVQGPITAAKAAGCDTIIVSMFGGHNDIFHASGQVGGNSSPENAFVACSNIVYNIRTNTGNILIGVWDLCNSGNYNDSDWSKRNKLSSYIFTATNAAGTGRLFDFYIPTRKVFWVPGALVSPPYGPHYDSPDGIHPNMPTRRRMAELFDASLRFQNLQEASWPSSRWEQADSLDAVFKGDPILSGNNIMYASIRMEGYSVDNVQIISATPNGGAAPLFLDGSGGGGGSPYGTGMLLWDQTTESTFRIQNGNTYLDAEGDHNNNQITFPHVFIVTNSSQSVLFNGIVTISNNLIVDAAHTITPAALTASRHVMTDANKALTSAAASGAVPIDADGTATTSGQVNALFPGDILTNKYGASAITLSNNVTIDAAHTLTANGGITSGALIATTVTATANLVATNAAVNNVSGFTNYAVGNGYTPAVWIVTNLARGTAPNGTAPNGSILTTTNGNMYIMATNAWFQIH